MVIKQFFDILIFYICGVHTEVSYFQDQEVIEVYGSQQMIQHNKD